MKKAKRFYDGDYSGPLNVAQRQMAKDYSMISEDRSAVANMPQSIVYKQWPKTGHYADFYVPDSTASVDAQQDADGAQMRRHKARSKY